MDKHLKVVIFSHARSGSSTLYRILQLHPDLNISEEPFQKRYGAWNPSERNHVDHVTDTASLEESLRDLFLKYNGIKVLQYQLPVDIYMHLLLKPDFRIVFLRRKNLLQAAVSRGIAGQTNVWKVWDLKGSIARAYGPLAPLSIDRLRDFIEGVRRNTSIYEGVVESRPGETYVKLWHEELFTPDLQANRSALLPVFHMLGLDMPVSNKADRLLDPTITKLNSGETYRLIPNVDEIEAELGNDETGWFFA